MCTRTHPVRKLNKGPDASELAGLGRILAGKLSLRQVVERVRSSALGEQIVWKRAWRDHTPVPCVSSFKDSQEHREIYS